MMKNTEWGAVAYLQHSDFGSRASVRVNNNSSYKTGYAAIKEPMILWNEESIEGNQFGISSSITKPYNTSVGYTASTTANITGVYDMSGGAYEYVMGYNIQGDADRLLYFYPDFLSNQSWKKYYDQYNNSSDTYFYKARILGDATGEMGPFSCDSDYSLSSWYSDASGFITSDFPWVTRGGYFQDGIGTGIFYSDRQNGDPINSVSFRVILTP